jgi:hypothetical protein
MKRLNPKTGVPFRRGDIGEDGRIFDGYNKNAKLTLNGNFYEKWYFLENYKVLLEYRTNYDAQRKSSKEKYIHRTCLNIKSKAKRLNIPFDLTTEFLNSIAPENCSVFGTKLNWGGSKDTAKHDSPSLDKIDATLGYVQGNVQWISQLANCMKRDATKDQLRQFASWINKVT